MDKTQFKLMGKDTKKVRNCSCMVPEALQSLYSDTSKQSTPYAGANVHACYSGVS